VKPLQPVVTGGYELFVENGFEVNLSNIQILVVVTTFVLMTVFWLIITRTALGRAQRACEQDRLMASLSGVNVDRTISLTFVLGAALAAVAGLLYLLYYGVIDFYIGFVAGIKAFTAAVFGGIGSLPGRHARRLDHRPDRDLLVGLCAERPRVQGRRRLLHARHRPHLFPDRLAWPSRGGEGLIPLAEPGKSFGQRLKSALADAIIAGWIAFFYSLSSLA
jgi:hypothetical protein